MDLDSIDWRPVRHADHEAIAAFECAIPAKPVKNAPGVWPRFSHPSQWEYDAQKIIHRLSNEHSFPPRAGTQIFVACDPGGIGAVASWTELAGPGDVHIDVFGIATRHRRRQGEDSSEKGVFARWCMGRALEEMETRAIEAEAPELYIEGEIWHANVPSRRMMEEFNFRVHQEYATGAITYNFKLPLAGAPIHEPRL